MYQGSIFYTLNLHNVVHVRYLSFLKRLGKGSIFETTKNHYIYEKGSTSFVCQYMQLKIFSH